jgi:hypothetical protein
MARASGPANSSFKRRYIIYPYCPAHPTAARFGAIANRLTKWHSFGNWVL